MKIATRSKTTPPIVTKRVEIRLNEDAVNAYKNVIQQRPQQKQQQHQQQQQQKQQQHSRHRQQTSTEETTITIVGASNRRTMRAMNIATTTSISKKCAQVRSSYGLALYRNAACQVNTIEPSNRLICNGPATASSSSSSVQALFQRNMNNCLNALMTLNEQHAHAKINLKTEYNAKLEQLKRDYERRSEEIKRKCISDTGF